MINATGGDFRVATSRRFYAGRFVTQENSSSSFTGRRRAKKTRFAVKFADWLSTRLITIGGVGTIVAVSLVGVLLVSVALPLFYDAELHHPRTTSSPWTASDRPLRVVVDEYQTIGWALYPDGTLQLFEISTGDEIKREQLFEDDAKLTSISVIPDIDDDEAKKDKNLSRLQVAVGFDDGSVRLGTIGFATSFPAIADVPQELRKMGIDETSQMNGGVVKVTQQRQFRFQEVVTEFENPPLRFGTEPIKKVAHAQRGKGFGVAVFTGDDKLVFANVRRRKTPDESIVYRIVSKSKDKAELDFDFSERGEPAFLTVPTRGDMIYAAWRDGHLLRFNTELVKEAKLAEELNLLDEDGGEVTVLDFALNRETLLVGDSSGHLRGWFPVKRADTSHLPGALPTTDGMLLAPVHTLPAGEAAVTSLGISERTRLVAVGYADGRLKVFHVTTDQLIAEAEPAAGEAVDFIAIAPKDDGIYAVGGDYVWSCGFEPGHPETTWSSLFGPVWYEGYEEPDMTWQSSFAGVGPEMKLGLWPLVFGTLKATFYSMLIGAPLALLAAIYTSEFSRPRAKATIKPVVEMMASLPSVVLGFLAALVFAPMVEKFVPTTLAAFFTVPLVFLLSAALWHLLPPVAALSLERFRFLYCLMLVPAGLVLAYLVGPLFESLFFAGNIMLWLDGQIGTGTGAWMLLLLPLSAFTITGLTMTFVNSWLRRVSAEWSRRKFVWLNLLKFGVGVAATFGLAWALSSLLTAVGLDPRGTYVDTYVQRNALVVGFAMGFAVIPIIYTIAEDALSTVPSHLRSASLGAGATPWQTTIRIVMPTAMSGLFSALMIGLGRAVGETMIVLMAGGNTPVREWNIFNGFRTLAANIAVELPEAVQGSTHYRTLFLAALALFVLTFVVNTVAELVRLRFRKRAIEL